MQCRYLGVGSMAALRTFGPWIALKKSRKVFFELLSSRPDHAIRRSGRAGARCTCKTTWQENENLFNIIYIEILYPKKNTK